MVRAVDQGHRDIDDRKSEGAARRRIAGAGFHGRKILPRHRSAMHTLREGEALAPGPGADLDWRDGSRTHIMSVVGSAADYLELQAVYQLLHQEVTVTYADVRR